MSHWLDDVEIASLLRADMSVVLLGCSTVELDAIGRASSSPIGRRVYRLDCLELDDDHRADARTAAAAHGLSIEFVQVAPESTYDLLFLSPRYLHRQSRPVGALRRASRLLRSGGVGVVGCQSSMAELGVSHARRLLELLVRPSEDDLRTQLLLSLSLLQSLPPFHWLRRNAALQQLPQPLDWTDGYTVHDHLLLRQPTPAVPRFCFLAWLDQAGFEPLRLAGRRRSGNASTLHASARHEPRLPPRLPPRWRALTRQLPPLFRSEIAELLRPARSLTHLAVVTRRGRGPTGREHASSLASPLAELQAALGGVLDGPGSHIQPPAQPPAQPPVGPPVGLSAGPSSATCAGSLRAGPSDLDSSDGAAGPQATRQQYEALPFPPRRVSDERHRLITSSLASLSARAWPARTSLRAQAASSAAGASSAILRRRLRHSLQRSCHRRS